MATATDTIPLTWPDRSATIGELMPALCKAQALFTPVEKTKTVKTDRYSYTYADLADIMEMLRKPLSDNGLALSHSVDDNLLMHTRLYHTSGEWISTALPISGGSSPQALGASITYMRRYSVSCLLAIVTEDDTDGPPQVEAKPARRSPRKTTTEPAAKKAEPNPAARIWQQLYRTQGALGIDKEAAEAMLRDFLRDDFGKESTKELDAKQANALIQKLHGLEKANTPPDEIPFPLT